LLDVGRLHRQPELPLDELTNFGQPIIFVEDANFENKGELLLVHRHEGLDLDPDWGGETLAAVARLWTRPSNVITEREGKKVRLRHDGTELRTIEMQDPPPRSAEPSPPDDFREPPWQDDCQLPPDGPEPRRRLDDDASQVPPDAEI